MKLLAATNGERELFLTLEPIFEMELQSRLESWLTNFCLDPQ